jgi:hypothetical protein
MHIFRMQTGYKTMHVFRNICFTPWMQNVGIGNLQFHVFIHSINVTIKLKQCYNNNLQCRNMHVATLVIQSNSCNIHTL